jgi:hypothetical protein
MGGQDSILSWTWLTSLSSIVFLASSKSSFIHCRNSSLWFFPCLSLSCCSCLRLGTPCGCCSSMTSQICLMVRGASCCGWLLSPEVTPLLIQLGNC